MHAAADGMSHEGAKPLSVSQPAIQFDLCPMSESDLAAAHALSRTVGWPHRLEDWQFALTVGEGLVAYSGDRMVGTAMWWRYEGRQARIGLVIVDPSIQRGGIGRRMMKAVIDRLDEPCIILNATDAGETLYRQLGFSGASTIIQHQGAAFGAPLVALRAGERIRPLGRNDAERLITLDAMALGARREKVIAEMMSQGDAVILDDGGETVGFAFFRRFGRGHVIGPVVARDTAAARALIAHWVGLNAGMFLRVDVPGESGLSDWLDGLGLARVSPVLTMVRGAALPTPGPYRTFGLVSQALG